MAFLGFDSVVKDFAGTRNTSRLDQVQPLKLPLLHGAQTAAVGRKS
jgi:hypothetical protein